LSKRILHDHHNDGVDRRGFLECMAWAGTGVVWTIAAGVPTSRLIAQPGKPGTGLSFVQISDTHLGFAKPANPDAGATLEIAVAKINSLPQQPEFILHTGDLSHLAKPAEFDAMDQLLKGAHQKQVFFVPGEHDLATDDGKEYLSRYGKNTKGQGWYSFDQKGVHFIGLVNSFQLEGMGKLGEEQLKWLANDVRALSASTPIVVFAHIPLWAVYPEWGWATADSTQALGYLKRFGSVTVLNGHIHQAMQKVEGNVTFHTAMSTAFPQPAPGKAQAPGPLKVPADQLKQTLGIANVTLIHKPHSLAIVDSPLEKGQ
jgi:Icc protein